MKLSDAFRYAAVTGLVCAVASPLTSEFGAFLGNGARVLTHTLVDPSIAKNVGMAFGLVAPGVVMVEVGKAVYSKGKDILGLFQLGA